MVHWPTLSCLLCSRLAGRLAGVLFARAKLAQQSGKPVGSRPDQHYGRTAWWNKCRRYPYAVYIMYALLAVLAFFLPRVWGSYWNYIIGTVGIYVILGLGLNIIVGLAGQLVLGYVAFFAIGAYTVALLTAPQPHSLGGIFGSRC